MSSEDYSSASEGAKAPFESIFNINNRRWLTTKEVAFYLGRSVDAIHMLVGRGHLRSKKYLGKLYFDRVEIDYLIETSEFRGV
jgi:excisionase family DNA binding protein